MKDIKKQIDVRRDFQISRGAVTCEKGLAVQKIATVIYDTAATDSSGVSNKTVAAHGSGVYIPAGAIITKVTYQVKTTFTSANDSATIAIHAAGANDIVTATAISAGGNVWDAGFHAATQDGTVTNYLGALSAEKEITFTVAVQALTAGKLVAFVEYILGL